MALGLTKQCINRSLQSGLTEAMENESFALELSSRSRDFKEGLLAFRESRAPSSEGDDPVVPQTRPPTVDPSRCT